MVSLRRHFVPNPVSFTDTRSRTKCKPPLGIHTRYDGLNQRIVKTVFDGEDTTTSEYFYNESWQLLEERTTAGEDESASHYVWDLSYVDAPITRLLDANADGDFTDTGDAAYYYTFDANENVTALIGLVETEPDVFEWQVVERYTYTPYGVATAHDPDWSNPATPATDGPLYAGYHFDAETSLYHVRNRHYDPSLGTFTTRDPIGYAAGDANLYRYVGNDPAGAVDPMGLNPIEDLFWGPKERQDQREKKMNFKRAKPGEAPPPPDAAQWQRQMGNANRGGAGKNPTELPGDLLALQEGILAGINGAISLVKNNPSEYAKQVSEVATGIFWDAPVGAVVGAAEAIMHPIQTAHGIYIAITNPLDVATALAIAAQETFQNGSLQAQGKLCGDFLMVFVPGPSAVGAFGKVTGVARKAGSVAKQVVAKSDDLVHYVRNNARLLYANKLKGTVEDLGPALSVKRVDRHAVNRALAAAQNICFVAGTPVVVAMDHALAEAREDLFASAEVQEDSPLLPALALSGVAVAASCLVGRERRRRASASQQADRDQTPAPRRSAGLTPTDQPEGNAADQARSEPFHKEPPVLGGESAWCDPPRTKRVYPKWFAGLALGICLAAILFFGGLGARRERADSTARSSHTAAATATMARVAPPTPACRAIETIGVGQRVITTPDGVFGNPSTESTAVNPATWRKVLLEATSVWEDGTRDVVRVETLQPLEWLEQHDAQPGASVPFPLDLVEMGIPDDLLATVVAVKPCPHIEAGPGCVVLTTVDHLNAFVFELALEDAAGSVTTVRPTGWHRFYSETRADWVPAKDLSPGEQVGGLSGSLTVIAASRVPGTHRVYNMTVEGDHVYHVTTLGALVHNNGCKQVAASASSGLKGTLDRINAGGKFPHRNDGTIFRNREGLLPAKPPGYYTEYVHPTPGVSGPGAQRIVVGKGGEIYHTPDHYKTFIPVPPGG